MGTDVDAAITHLNGGIVGPLLSARIDVDKYHSGCEIMENFLPMIEGPAMKRPGTKFVREVKFSDKLTILVPFRFSITQTYFLELGDLYMRVHRDGGTINENPFSIAGSPTAANPVVVTSSGAHGYISGDSIFIRMKLMRRF